MRVSGLSLFLVTLLFMCTIPFFSCEKDDCPCENEVDDCDSCIIAYKPNIYIYPKEQTHLLINLEFPQGGSIITSIPEYKTGWDVVVDTTGMIENQYNYLFYESKQPDVWQQSKGWIVEQAKLTEFFSANMVAYGFFGREIQDFIDYWIPRLKESKYYAIYPQNSSIIDSVIELTLSDTPENLLRLFYLVEGCEEVQNLNLEEVSNIPEFKRESFFVTEWGVILR